MKTKMALYDEDFGGIVVETTDGHRFGWQVIKDGDGTIHLPRFTESDGARFFYEQEAADCESFDEDGLFNHSFPRKKGYITVCVTKHIKSPR